MKYNEALKFLNENTGIKCNLWKKSYLRLFNQAFFNSKTMELNTKEVVVKMTGKKREVGFSLTEKELNNEQWEIVQL